MLGREAAVYVSIGSSNEHEPLLMRPKGGAASATTALTLAQQIGFSGFYCGYILSANLLTSYLLPKKIASLVAADERSTWLGITFTIANTVLVLISPFVGHASDSFTLFWGRRKPFILVGALCVVGSSALIYFANALMWAVLGLVLACIGTALAMTAITAGFADIVPEDQASTTGAHVAFWGQLGAVVAAVLVIFSAAIATWELYSIGAVACALGVVACLVSFTDKLADAASAKSASVPLRDSSIRHGPYLWLLAASMFNYLAQILPSIFLLYVLQSSSSKLGDRTFSPDTALGMFNAATTLMGMAATVFVAHTTLSLSLQAALMSWAMTPVLVVLAVRPPDAFTLTMASCLSYGFGTGGFTAVSLPLLSRIIKARTAVSGGPDTTGFDASIWAIANLLPLALGPALLGVIVDRFNAIGLRHGHPHLGFSLAFALGAACSVLAGLCALRARPVALSAVAEEQRGIDRGSLNSR